MLKKSWRFSKKEEIGLCNVAKLKSQEQTDSSEKVPERFSLRID